MRSYKPADHVDSSAVVQCPVCAGICRCGRCKVSRDNAVPTAVPPTTTTIQPPSAPSFIFKLRGEVFAPDQHKVSSAPPVPPPPPASRNRKRRGRPLPPAPAEPRPKRGRGRPKHYEEQELTPELNWSNTSPSVEQVSQFESESDANLSSDEDVPAVDSAVTKTLGEYEIKPVGTESTDTLRSNGPVVWNEGPERKRRRRRREASGSVVHRIERLDEFVSILYVVVLAFEVI